MRPLRVGELVRYISSILTQDSLLKRFQVEGEVVNFRRTKYGYFDLREGDDLISAVCFQPKILEDVQEGERIIVSGRITTYVRGSKYQILVDAVERVGRGAHLLALEKLRQKLYAEGLFAPSRKKLLPRYPKTIGMITSAGGAVLHDFLNELQQRYRLAEVIVCPAQVQGKEALSSLLAAVDFLESDVLEEQGISKPDVLVLARGGGSNEHLEVFNEEALVRRLAHCRIPVISAVGHQVDFTLCDEVADVRASTPTEAAVLATPATSEIHQWIDACCTQIAGAIQGQIAHRRSAIHRLIAEMDAHQVKRFQTESYLLFEGEAPVPEQAIAVRKSYVLAGKTRRFSIRVEAEMGKKEETQ